MVTDVASTPMAGAASMPDAHGRFGRFGGSYEPESLMPALLDLDEAYEAARKDPGFQAEIDRLAKYYVGRPTPVYYAENLSRIVGGAKIYVKREDLAHT